MSIPYKLWHAIIKACKDYKYGANDVKITIEEIVEEDPDDDDNGAEIVAYISGISKVSYIEITNTTGNS